MPFSSNKVLIIGLGLIGGSLAAALRRTGKHEVWGYDNHHQSIQIAEDQGVIDQGVNDLPSAVAAADVVVLATPVKVVEELLFELAPHVDGNTLLTDVGSVKGSIVNKAYEVFGIPPAGFVPGHPILFTYWRNRLCL